MIAGPRAKITDFGMSKLASVNPRMTALTLCPGNVLYMSPEALDEAKSYTAKLDIFSFGVIVIQILTRKFPNPTDRFRIVRSEQREDEDDDEESEVRKVVPETERRQAHLNLIAATHSLKPVVLQCLKKKESLRPSALQLGERLSALKGSSQYTESRQQAESNSEVEQLQLQLRGQRILTDAKTKEAEEYQEQIAQLGNAIEDRDRQLLEQQYSLVDNILSVSGEGATTAGTKCAASTQAGHDIF
ncbi:Calmodulin-binding receptor-like cytoplasmic kinase 3 [Geodia barretti]|uniref:Calmodulin-binding receptor-like cytoplasmic kinase 3 n=1 Tax=Geodia barretti TaxID=519541 RepID=A0AA35RZK6_GEOBA|nr:Calmodulin-binding receptor-like cytoplasmic kinase 3 [Geodia barretti]